MWMHYIGFLDSEQSDVTDERSVTYSETFKSATINLLFPYLVLAITAKNATVIILNLLSKMKHYWIVIFSLLSANFLFAQISTSAALDSTTLLIGDQVQLHIQVKHEADVTVQEADIAELEKAEGIEVLSVSEWDTLGAGLLQKNVLITSFDSGYHFVPSIPIAYSRNGQQGTVQTPQLAFTVNVPPADTLELAPIKPIIEEPINVWDYLPYVGGALILLLLAFIAWYFWTYKPPAVESRQPVVPLQPHEIALQKLEALKKAQLWQQGKIKQYHSELTHIVREYVENRFSIPALESTTDEILQQLRPLDFWADWGYRLQEMLQAADLVKFAKAEPPQEFHNRMMTYAENFVQSTKPIPKVEELEKEETKN